MANESNAKGACCAMLVGFVALALSPWAILSNEEHAVCTGKAFDDAEAQVQERRRAQHSMTAQMRDDEIEVADSAQDRKAALTELILRHEAAEDGRLLAENPEVPIHCDLEHQRSSGADPFRPDQAWDAGPLPGNGLARRHLFPCVSDRLCRRLRTA